MFELRYELKIDENGNVKAIETAVESEKASAVRPKKGKSILAAIADYVVIDIETTGLDTKFDSIIELSAIRYKDDNQVENFSSLVNPGFVISDFITNLTGITNEALSGAHGLTKVLPEYIAFIGGDTIVGHNVNFDVNFIYDRAESIGVAPISNDFIDTMRFSRRLHPGLSHHRLPDLVGLYGVDVTTFHRALADCETTAKCYQAMKREATETGFDYSARRSGGYNSVNLKGLTPTEENFNPENPLFGKNCVFTGKLERLSREAAAQLVVNIGGQCENNVTKKTNFLILGNNDYCTSIKDGKSNKQKKAESLILKGQDIQILSENVFYEMILSE